MWKDVLSDDHVCEQICYIGDDYISMSQDYKKNLLTTSSIYINKKLETIDSSGLHDFANKRDIKYDLLLSYRLLKGLKNEFLWNSKNNVNFLNFDDLEISVYQYKTSWKIFDRKKWKNIDSSETFLDAVKYAQNWVVEQSLICEQCGCVD